MILDLYHGSEKIIKKPEYGKGKIYNDYGKGFYCTQDKSLSFEWAVKLNQNGYSNHYFLDDKGLKILNLNDGKHSLLEWLTILLKNRIINLTSIISQEGKDYLAEYFSIDYEKFDLIVGYRADDSYFSFTEDFLNGTIPFSTLKRAMHLGKLGEQIVLKSEESFNRIKFIDADVAETNYWYEKKVNRDTKAREDYFNREKNKRQKDDIYIRDIIDEGIKRDDKRIF